jgi:hypothetical protein
MPAVTGKVPVDRVSERITAHFKTAPNRSYGKVPYELSESEWGELQQLRTGWRDIATAPRDGTQILLYFLGERVIGKWSSHYGEWAGLNVKWHDGAQTITTMRDGMGNGGPTLWHPLPAPPPEERADG